MLWNKSIHGQYSMSPGPATQPGYRSGPSQVVSSEREILPCPAGKGATLCSVLQCKAHFFLSFILPGYVPMFSRHYFTTVTLLASILNLKPIIDAPQQSDLYTAEIINWSENILGL